MKSGRLILILIAAGIVGFGPGLPVLAEPIQTPVQGTQKPSFEHLAGLVSAAEKAAQVEDWDLVATRVDEAETAIANLGADQLLQPEVKGLLERLKVLENQLEDDAETPSEGEDGLRMTTEVVGLAGEDLHKELEQVKAAEQDAEFDFPIDLNDKVLAWVHLFTVEKRGFMEGALSRGTQYLPMVRQIFEEEGVPKDLAYLAVIESGFKNNAKSRAKAVGMWQFIRSTGRVYGLTGNAWVEERRDPVKSARASARYLRNLYESCGDWYLALVGYNAGPLTTERAVEALGTKNFWDMYRSRYLRNQTKNYVPELLAAILVGHSPERYGLHVPQMMPYAYETVHVDKMTSLAVLARYAGTDVDALKELNPELLRGSTPPTSYPLRVPPGTSGITARALAKIPSGQRLDFGSYVIRRGDTLAKVAARFNVSPGDLLASNNFSSKAQFRVGKRIQVPPAAALPVDRKDLLPRSERERVALEQPIKPLPPIPEDIPVEPPVVDPPLLPVSPVPPSAPIVRAIENPRPVPAAETSAHPKTHVVKAGETLFSISERYGLDLKSLRKWNRLKGNRIMVGQTLKLQKP